MRLRRCLIGSFIIWLAVVVWLATMLEAPAPPDDPPSPPPGAVDSKVQTSASASADANQLVADALAAAADNGVATATAEGDDGGATVADAADASNAADGAGPSGNATSIAAAARSRVAAEASAYHDDNADGVAEQVGPEHAALQGAAVELLTAQSECGIQTFTNRHTARAKSVYDDEVQGRSFAGSRHGAERAFDADSATSYHSACGLPAAPWWISYRFASPTTVSTIRLASDAPADYPKAWELQGRSDAKEAFVTILRVSHDPGIACAGRLHQFRCDQPQTKSYEVRSPGDFLEYRLLVRSVSNVRRKDRNCLQLAEISFVGPCAASNLILHLDASAISLAPGSLVSEWRDQSGHGHHARRRGAEGVTADGGMPLALPASAALEVDEASEAPPVVDDGGSPRLVKDRRSGRPAVSWEYAVGGGFLEAAGLQVGPSDSMSVFVVASTRTEGWPARGSKVKPIYCLGDPAFWAGTLCVAGVVGNASFAGYGGRGQPGEGEYMTGLTSDAMADGQLHILAVTVDGKAGLFRASVDGAPALVPSFIATTTPSIGVAQLGGSSTSRSRRFHGLIAEVVHYNSLLSTRQMTAIGHYLQHKYKIRGSYTDERAALSEAAAAGAGGGGSNASAGGTAALAAAGAEGRTAGRGGRNQIQLMLPPESGCLAHRGALKRVGMEPCDEGSAYQSWEWEAAALELRWASDGTQCLNWMEEEGAFGAWPCEFAESEFEFQPLAHRFCLVSAPTRCVSQLIASMPMLLRAAKADGTPDGSAEGRLCLQFVRDEAEVSRVPCNESESKQRFEFDAATAEFHVSDDKRLCLDFFAPVGRWGIWGCHHAANEQFRSQTPRVDAYCVQSGGQSRCVGVYRSEAVMRVLPRGQALCLEFVAPLQPLLLATCSNSPRQLWRYDKGALRYARDASLCVDRFSSGAGAWGVWTCESGAKPNQHFLLGSGNAHETGATLCTDAAASAGAGAQCLQRAAEDQAHVLALPGDARCLELSSERVAPKAKAVRAVRPDDDDDDDEPEEEAPEDGDEGGADGNRIGLVPCSEGEHATTRQRWRYKSDGTFSPVDNATQCLELVGSGARTAPCVPAEHERGGGGVESKAAARQSFRWEADRQRYCASLLSATHFQIKRCVRAAPSPLGIAVSFRARAGKEGCLESAGSFRMLEAAPCSGSSAAQQWVYRASTRGFRSVSDASQCLRWFEEAGTFAAWACQPEDGAAGGAASYKFRPAAPTDRLDGAAGHHQAGAQAFCVDRAGGGSACLVVSDE